MHYSFDLIILQCTNRAVRCYSFQQVVLTGFEQNGLRLWKLLDSKLGAESHVS